MIQMDRREDNLANAVSSDDEDPLEEEDERIRSIHFLKRGESSASNAKGDGGGGEGDEKVNVTRYDEMGSFLSRSQRSLDMPDPLPSEEELAERRVKIKEQVEADSVHDVDPMSPEEAEAYYMTDADFRRVDVDVELTTIRYEKAQKVHCFCVCLLACLFVFLCALHITIERQLRIIMKIIVHSFIHSQMRYLLFTFTLNHLLLQNKGKHNEEENPTRGLEEMLDTKKVRANLRKKHRQAVLTEMVRQKTSGGGKQGLDWEKIRAAAEPYSKETAQIAYEIALQDAGKPVPKHHHKSHKGGDSSKKKKGLFGMFKKK